MSIEVFQQFFLVQHEQIVGLWPQLQQADEDAIHRLRVGIKKTRAMWRLLGSLQPGVPNYAHWLPCLHKLYGHAGAVRDAQVQERLLWLYEEAADLYFGGLRKHLRHELDRAQGRLQLLLIDHPVPPRDAAQRMLEQHLHSLAQSPWQGHLQTLAEQQCHHLRTLMPHEGSLDRLHEFRKRFKAHLYTMRLATQILPDFRPPLSLKRVEWVAEELGRWHDKAMLLQQVEHYRRHHRSAKTKRLQRHLRGEVYGFMDTFDQLLALHHLHTLCAPTTKLR